MELQAETLVRKRFFISPVKGQEKLSTQTHEIDKRVVRLETLVEVAKYNRITE